MDIHFFTSVGFKYVLLVFLIIIDVMYLPWTLKFLVTFLEDGRRRDEERKDAIKLLELKKENQIITYSKNEVARMLHISYDAASELFEQEDFPAQHIDGEVFVEAGALREYLRKRNETI